jgi:hypothetical protein
VGETRVLAINAGDELEEDELPGFDADAQARRSLPCPNHIPTLTLPCGPLHMPSHAHTSPKPHTHSS